jgi:hypothetical protein
VLFGSESFIFDHFCSLVVRVPGYRSTGTGFPALPDFLRNSESGMGSIQPCEDN